MNKLIVILSVVEGSVRLLTNRCFDDAQHDMVIPHKIYHKIHKKYYLFN